MDFSNHQAIYLQIADYVCDSILIKKWSSEDKIPSVREMAISIEVNPNTVARAYTYLQDQKIIYNKRGLGYYISPDAPILTAQIKRKQFIKLELPRMFKNMQLLEISINEIEQRYQKHLISKAEKNDTG
ncbi:MAG: GntR family transcriptional regulator [Deltaproteobacteria bacterium]|nr:GntR family transcriptional regulator [Deltaproteobacteria bacterium]